MTLQGETQVHRTVCPRCGYKQKTKAEEKVKCHRCRYNYTLRTAKRWKRKEGEGEFHTYSRRGGPQ